MFLYETHMHTSEGSHCGASTAKEQVDFYKSLGYDGIFVTDHFLNGNSNVNYFPEITEWEDKINFFCKGYENAKKRGDEVGLKVFFGLEFNFCSTEWLVYGLDKSWLINHPEIMMKSPKDFLKMAKENGAVIVQAHPFREAEYIDCFRIYPYLIDGVEVFNAHNCQRANTMAKFFAENYDLPQTCGSDCHKSGDMKLCAVGSETEICSHEDYLHLLRNRKLKLITDLKGVNENEA